MNQILFNHLYKLHFYFLFEILNKKLHINQICILNTIFNI